MLPLARPPYQSSLLAAGFNSEYVSYPFSDVTLPGNRLATYHDQVLAMLFNTQTTVSVNPWLMGAYGALDNGYSLLDYELKTANHTCWEKYWSHIARSWLALPPSKQQGLSEAHLGLLLVAASWWHGGALGAEESAFRILSYCVA
jgi:hypothetical protein